MCYETSFLFGSTLILIFLALLAYFKVLIVSSYWEEAGETEPLHPQGLEADHQDVDNGGEEAAQCGQEHGQFPAEHVTPASHEAVNQEARQGVTQGSHLECSTTIFRNERERCTGLRNK